MLGEPLMTCATPSFASAAPQKSSAAESEQVHAPQCATAADVAASTRQLCGDTQADEMLQTIGLQAGVVAKAARLLAGMGLRTAMDMELLGGGPEAQELMQELRTADGLSLGDRAKIRLLVGDREHLERLSTPPTSWQACSAAAERGADAVIGEAGSSAWRRQQQDQANSSDGGISFDTIAIVLSVLVGGVGYIVQAYTARRAEHAAAQQAHESHLAEQKRQREHEQMLAQIERTSRWLDDCCRPIYADLGHLTYSRQAFVAATIFELEGSNPEVVEKITPFIAKAFPPGDDGNLSIGGHIVWRPTLPQGLTRVFGSNFLSAPSAAAVGGLIVDAMTSISTPWCDELPTAILDLISAEPTCAVAESYRRFIRVEQLQYVERIAKALIVHSATIE
eukprot:SAG31_NODE_6651_length_1937_cov_1.539173_1_plen_394_part_00